MGESSVSVSSNFVWGKKKQKFRQGAILVYTILYYVYMRNINITLQLLHSELPYILLNFDFLYYQCRVAWNVGIYPFASQGYNVSHAISASPPPHGFPCGVLCRVGGGGFGRWALGPGEKMVVQLSTNNFPCFMLINFRCFRNFFLQDIWYTLLSLQYLGREGGWGGGFGRWARREKMVVQQTLNLY